MKTGFARFGGGPQGRLRQLKASTLLAGAASLLCGVGALQFAARAYAASSGAVHVPDAAAGGALAPALYLMLGGAVAILAMLSLGRLARLPVGLAVGGLLLAGAGGVLLLAPGARLMQQLPSALERQLMGAEPAAAARLLQAAKVHPAALHYALAQLALRGGDQAALRQHAETVLQLADEWAYGVAQPPAPVQERPAYTEQELAEVRALMKKDPDRALGSTDSGKLNAAFAAADPARDSGPRAPGAMDVVERFRPAVVHALDVALNGAPLTQVGMGWEQQHGAGHGAGTPAATMALGLGALLLAAAALGLGALWSSMLHRVRRIEAQLPAGGAA